MKLKPGILNRTAAIAAIALLSLNHSAVASTVTVTGDLDWSGKITNRLYIELGGSSRTVRAGEPSLSVVNVSGTTPPTGLDAVPNPEDFADYMWCIEPNQSAGSAQHTWDLIALEDAPVPGSPMQNANDLRLLFGNVYPVDPIDGVPTGGTFRDAFQLAIWEITKETETQSSGSLPLYDFSSGFFQTQSGVGGQQFADAVSMANDWLTALNHLNLGLASTFDSTLRADNLFALARDGRQDYVVAVNPVPLPAAAWLFLSAIVGTGLIGRRRTKRQT